MGYPWFLLSRVPVSWHQDTYVRTDTHVNLLCKLSVVCIPYGYSFVVSAFSALAYIQGLARKKIKVHLPFACQLCRTSEWGLKVDCYFNRVKERSGLFI